MINDIDKAIEFVNSLNDENLQSMIDGEENLLSLLDELQKYRNLSTLDELEEMLEMRKQKKVVEVIPVIGSSEKYECPNCGSILTGTDVFAGHCKWCGQAITYCSNNKCGYLNVKEIRNILNRRFLIVLRNWKEQTFAIKHKAMLKTEKLYMEVR